jgi:uncharacterized membrane protein YeaQ/YmgE (transglycosylase-associated protein family)
MEIIWMLIVGLVVGALAKLLMPGRDPGGLIVTSLIGIAGALIAGLVGRSLGWYRIDEGPGIIASILGAMFLLFLYRVLFRRQGGVPRRPI